MRPNQGSMALPQALITTANTRGIIPGEGGADAMHAGRACVLAGEEQRRRSDLIFKAKSCFSYLQKILNIRNEARSLAVTAVFSRITITLPLAAG